jgi:hypothetical protein
MKVKAHYNGPKWIVESPYKNPNVMYSKPNEIGPQMKKLNDVEVNIFSMSKSIPP